MTLAAVNLWGRRIGAVSLAEGADVVVSDVCAPVSDAATYPAPTPDDLAETVRLVEETGRRAISAVPTIGARSAAARRSSMRLLVQLPMKMWLTATSSIRWPGVRPI